MTFWRKPKPRVWNEDEFQRVARMVEADLEGDGWVKKPGFYTVLSRYRIMFRNIPINDLDQIELALKLARKFYMPPEPRGEMDEIKEHGGT